MSIKELSQEASAIAQSKSTYQKVIKLRKALEAIHNPMRLHGSRTLQSSGSYQPAQFAKASSSFSLDLGAGTAAVLESYEEVNNLDTSYSTFEPDWTLSSTEVTIGGTYDGSNGSGTLTFWADKIGVHGVDDLKIKVYAPDDTFIEDINIDKDDPIDQEYSLSNGLTLTLGEGSQIKSNTFTVDVNASVPSSFDPVSPGWSAASTAQSGITGIYDGSQGTGTLTFDVNGNGTHGVDDLQIKVYAPDGSFIENIDIDKNDPLSQQYTLSNGLIFTLGAGEVNDNDSFTLDVYEAAPTALNAHIPDWDGLGTSTAQATIDGTYDGSNGSGTLTFKVDKEGTHSVHDLKIKVYAPDDSFIEDINIDQNDPVSQQYTLSNGLTLTLGNGDLVKSDTFTIDVTDTPPSSFTGFKPAWNGLFSDAQVTLNGTYDGSNGTGTFNFRVDNEGTHGQDDLKIKVYDPDGVFLEDININKEDPLNTQYTLQNGIILTLGAGDLLKDDTFTLTFNDTIGGSVDPTKPFNGTGDNNPNFEYGYSVTDGSFELNGITIDVYASDSINDVLDRINQSGAGVTATFDVAAEKVVLTQNTTGAEAGISVGNDTSGFLVAVKLDTAVPVSGVDGDADTVIADVAIFSAVQSGMITINDTDITIDVLADSLDDVIQRINDSGAGVTANLSQSGQSVSIISDDITKTMLVDSGDTGFFPAIGITDGSYNPTSEFQATSTTVVVSSRRRMSIMQAEAFTTRLKEVANVFSALFDDKEVKSNSGDLLSALRNDLRSAVSAAFDSDYKRLRTDFGVNFDFTQSAKKVFDITFDDRNALVKNLTRDGRPVNKFFFGSNAGTNDGLLEKILNVLKSAESVFKTEFGTIGLFVNKRV